MKTSSKMGMFVCVLLLAIVFQPQVPTAHASLVRQVAMPVKVVFVGLNPALVDTSFIKWNGNLPSTSYGEVYYPQPNVTGVQYNVQYSFTFADEAYKQKLVSFLQSIQQAKTGRNPWFYVYMPDESGFLNQVFYSTNYVVYDANQVESWMYSNQQDLGGFPSNGWTLMLLNLTDALPSLDWNSYKAFIGSYRQTEPNGTAHYYGINPRDGDLGYTYRYRDFMTGWGAVHRFWFDDLSAGPSFQTYPEDIPLQIALRDNNVSLASSYGKNWLTEYLADYVYQATINIVTPWYLYPPIYSNKYSFNIHIFDNRTTTEKSQVDVHSTIKADQVKESFQDLIPYSQVEVSVTFENLTNYPDLQQILNHNYRYSDSFTAGIDFGSPQKYGIVDARPVYQYLVDHLRQFEPNYRRDRTEFTDPAFLFALSNNTVFAWDYKWLIGPFGGVALGDMALIGSSQFDFLRGNFVSPAQPNVGIGFTFDAIHELGHDLGLTHPHDPGGPTGDFTLSPLSYYTYTYTWGQRDRDALQRAHVDQIYFEIESAVPYPSSDLANQLSVVDTEYSQMNYTAALTSALKAESMIGSGAPSSFVFSQPVIYVLIGLIVGVAITWLTVIIVRHQLTSGTRRRKRD